MRLGKFFMAAAVATMAVAPAMADPVNPAASLSISGPGRAGTPASHKGELAGGGFIIALIAAAAVIAGIVVVATNKNHPSSP